ncbi:MAG: hypothetical protein IKV54_04115 [Clostridia bacterium]|nr:hypothetical protein [Clostridia bacterium]
MKKTRKIATSAVLCAMSVIILYFGAVIDVMFLTMAAICALVVVYAVIEIRGSYPWLIYAATSILSMLLLPNKLPALTYLVFAGLYPIIKSYAERLPLVIAWLIKLLVFNASLTALVFVSKSIMGLEDLTFGFSPVVYALGNLTFLLFDYVLTKLITLYMVKLRARFKNSTHFNY